MFPYITIRWSKIYMTGFGIVIWFIVFFIIAYYLIKKYHQDFWKFFYWLPIFIIIIYLMWSYADFALTNSFLPKTRNDILTILSPYGYKFHLTWVILWAIISLNIFFKKIKRNENKKIWIDIFFYSIWLSIIPMGIFLLLWDNFIGKPCNSLICIKPLNIESELNKFNWVFPVWLFISIWAFISVLIIWIIRRSIKKFWLWIIWFIILILLINIIIVNYQNYPKYWTISTYWIIFDIKQYISFIAIMMLLYTQQKRKKEQI